MATDNLKGSQKELTVSTTGEPTDQLLPEETEPETDDNQDTEDEEFDNESITDDDEDLDEDEVKRLFPGEDDYTEDADDDGEDDEPYEGLRYGDREDEGLVDDNMSGMPVIPSPS